MSRIAKLVRPLPPVPALLVILALFVLVPFYGYTASIIQTWAFGASPAIHLIAPYFRTVVIAQIAGGFVLAILLLLVRSPASVWISLTAIWLAGPPVRFLITGIILLSASSGRRSVPGDWSSLWMAAVFPLAATICLLCFRRVRIHYGLTSSAPRS